MSTTHGTPIIAVNGGLCSRCPYNGCQWGLLLFGATPLTSMIGAAGAKSPIDHHYRGAVSNTHGAPLSFPLWGHVPLEQTPSHLPYGQSLRLRLEKPKHVLPRWTGVF